MNILFDIFYKYKTPLNHEGSTCQQYLDNLLSDYICDIQKACYGSDERQLSNIIIDKVLSMVPIMEETKEKLIQTIVCSENKQDEKATIIFFDMMDSLKPYIPCGYAGGFREEIYYRMREDDGTFELERKELFHVPLSKKDKASVNRYSMKGNPCLYLSSQPQLCWYECDQPNVFAISKFLIPQKKENTLYFLDFSQKSCVFSHDISTSLKNARDDKERARIENILLGNIVIFPLRAACSLITCSESDNKEEYIIPQLLLKWIEQDTLFHGIKYESVSKYSEAHPYGGANIVFVSKGFDEDGYAINLRKTIKVTTPKKYDLTAYSLKDGIENYLFSLGLDKGPEDFEYF